MVRILILEQPGDECFHLVPEATIFKQITQSITWVGLILTADILPDSKGCEIRLPELVNTLITSGMKPERLENWTQTIDTPGLVLSAAITLRQGTYRVLTKFD